MAQASIGPGGFNLSGAPCTNNTFLADQNSPIGALKDTLTIQRVKGLETMLYPDMARAVDMHMPMRASSASRVDGVDDYRIAVGYDGLLNQTSLTDVTPSRTPYTDNRALQTGLGTERNKAISAATNGNAEACNPSIDGPMPVIGHEGYSRRGYTLRLPIPPLCLAAYTNKEKFHDTLAAEMSAVQNATVTAFAAGQYRWMINQSRFNAAPIQQSMGDGRAKLPAHADLFSNGTFGRVPEHYGSADWIAAMLRLSELPRRANVTVDLPTVIFEKYKLDLAGPIGLNVFEQAGNITNALNNYQRTLFNDSLVYQDRQTGRKITFRSTDAPTYVEVEESGVNRGAWYFQEPWIFRDSETAGQVMPRENPNYGVACSVPNRTLAAIVTISVDGQAKPFAKESFPVNPDAGLRSLINKYAKSKGIEVNTTLAELYPTSVETTLFTGIDLQVWMLNPMNQRFRDAGYNCDAASNIENTWIGGFTKISGVFVEENPRQVVHMLLRVPAVDNCVELFAPCADAAVIPAGGDIDPGIKTVTKQVLPVPDPITPPAASAGTIFVLKRSTTVTADCLTSKTVTIPLERRGGTLGTISATVAGTPSAHGGSLAGSVSFADGVTTGTLTLTIAAWAAVVGVDQTTENFTITFSGAALDPNTFTTHKVCIKQAKSCAGDCEPDTGCPTC
jgi:hypothetical protein